MGQSPNMPLIDDGPISYSVVRSMQEWPFGQLMRKPYAGSVGCVNSYQMRSDNYK